MLNLARRGGAGLETAASLSIPDDAVWIDLLSPTREEELAVEAALGLSLPTREEMEEIEASSRLYQEDGATFMTAMVLFNSEAQSPVAGPVTFVLAGRRLITIRYCQPKAFALFSAQAERQPSLCADGIQTFFGLLDALVDRTADILERTALETEAANIAIFRPKRVGGFLQIMTGLGRTRSLTSKVRDSLVSLARLISFAALAAQIEDDRDHRAHLKSLQRDVQSLTDHAGRLADDVTFLLDAALGLINIEQNAIIKIFSVAAAAFLPPTLIASIYGMNFAHMPELAWPWGYPLALLLMVLSSIVPLIWFRHKGWL